MSTLRETSPLERALHFRSLPIMQGLPTRSVIPYAEYSREYIYRKGEALMREGEPVSTLHSIIRGRVSVWREGAKLGEVAPPNGVGFLGTMARDPHGQTVIAEEETLTLALSSDVLFDIFEDDFEIFSRVLRQVSRQLVEVRFLHPLNMPPAPAHVPPPSLEMLDFVERLVLMRRQSGPFATGSLDGLTALVRSMEQVDLPAGTVLWREGDASVAGYMIIEGWIRCTGTRGHDYDAGPGFGLGFLTANAEVPRDRTATVLHHVTALKGTASTFYDVMEDHFEMALDSLAFLASDLLQRYQETGALGA